MRKTTTTTLHNLLILLLIAVFSQQIHAVTVSAITGDTHNTLSTALGDLDGDGDLDLVAGNNGDLNRLYLNDGNGVYGDGLGGRTGRNVGTVIHSTYSVSLGDVDGDGDLDLVVGNFASTNLLYLNQGSDTDGNWLGFSAGSDIGTDAQDTYSISLGDVDGDGHLDLVVGNNGSVNRLYRNQGSDADGTWLGFGTGSDIGTDTQTTRSVSLGDVDGDGTLDLVVGNYGSTNRIHLNQGSDAGGNWLGLDAGSDIGTDADATTTTSLGDVDGDGDLDLVVGNYNQVNRLYRNDGNGVMGDGLGGSVGSDIGTNALSTTATGLGDVDGDGDLDLLVLDYDDGTRLYVNDGAAQWQSYNGINLSTSGFTRRTMSLGDVDGDGDLDLVEGHNGVDGDYNYLYINDNTGFGIGLRKYWGWEFTPLGAGDEDAELGDVDGDGDLDLVMASWGGFSHLYLNQGHDTNGYWQGYDAGSDIGTDTDYNPTATGLGDVDGDGDLDVVEANWGPLFLYLNQGTDTGGNWQGFDVVGTQLDNLNQPSTVSLGDLDGDGDLDLVVGSDNGPNRFYLNQGSDAGGNWLGFDAGSDIGTDAHQTQATSLGDVDGDGDLDLVVGNSDSYNRLYLNQGNDGGGHWLGFAAGMDIDAVYSDDTQSISLGDLDGDGDLDLVVGAFQTPNRYHLNLGADGSGNWLGYDAGNYISTKAQSTLAISLGDMDGDGDLDLVVGRYGNTGLTNLLYLNQGNDTGGDFLGFDLGSSIYSENGGQFETRVTALADVDDDGDLDLVDGTDTGTYLYTSSYANSGHFMQVRPAAISIQRKEVSPNTDITIRCRGLGELSAAIDYRFEHITTDAGDFTATLGSGTLSWADGTCVDKTIPLPIFNDDLIEGEEELWLIMENPIGLYNSDPFSQQKRYKIIISEDSDGDGVIDKFDAFPLDATETLDTDGDGIGNNADTDDDGDGVEDSADAFPLDSSESVDTDGDGTGNNADTDDDGDGVEDSADAFPLDSSESVDTDGDGTGNNADTDDDGDGVTDSADAFPLDSSESVDTDGDGTGNNADIDDDGDSVGDGLDAFPLNANEQYDTDGDGIGNNADSDDDGDGVADVDDAFPLDASESVDTDGDGTGDNADTDDDDDGVADSEDAFPLDPNESLDTDGDGIGNTTDSDDDGDNVADSEDTFPLDANEAVDTDGDEIGNNADSDDDGDGVADSEDAFPLDAGETIDTDADGTGDNADTDDDGDGVPDEEDAYPLDASQSSEAASGDGGGGAADPITVLLWLITGLWARRRYVANKQA